LHEQEERRLFYVAMTRAMDELYVCGKAGKDKGQPAPPKKYMRELVSLAPNVLRGSIQSQILVPEVQIAELHAAAEPVLTVSQWTQLPPREDARLLELSASALSSYEGCPLSYKLKYDWHLPEDATAPLQFGNAMHQALKAYFDGVRAGRAPDLETVLACFRDEFAKAKIDEAVQRELYEKDGCAQLAAMLESEFAHPEGDILHNEHKFKLEIGGMLVRGRLDRLDRQANGDVTVLDYKTGKAKTQKDADESLQLSIYALAAVNMGHKPSSLVFINTQNGTAVTSSRSPEQLRQAEDKVRELATKIAAGEFDPKPSGRCGWCSYQSICPTQEAPLPRPPAELAAKMN
jgi:putative RecB family exonuclease